MKPCALCSHQRHEVGIRATLKEFEPFTVVGFRVWDLARCPALGGLLSSPAQCPSPEAEKEKREEEKARRPGAIERISGFRV